MSTLRPNQDPDLPPDGGRRTELPLRWAVILLVAAIAGFAVYRTSGLAEGVSVSVAVAGLLYIVLG